MYESVPVKVPHFETAVYLPIEPLTENFAVVTYANGHKGLISNRESNLWYESDTKMWHPAKRPAEYHLFLRYRCRTMRHKRFTGRLLRQWEKQQADFCVEALKAWKLFAEKFPHAASVFPTEYEYIHEDVRYHIYLDKLHEREKNL